MWLTSTSILIFFFLSMNVQVTHLLGVLSFGWFCFIFGASKLIVFDTMRWFLFFLFWTYFGAFFIGFHFFITLFYQSHKSFPLYIVCSMSYFVLCYETILCFVNLSSASITWLIKVIGIMSQCLISGAENLETKCF